MKLIIQIPCFNEEASLPDTLSKLPRSVEGFTEVEWLIIDDGSTDSTVEVALAHGVDYVVTHATNLGLARAFSSGIEACIRRGADVIVNTDADNQYDARDIPALTRPILSKQADMVVGSRPIDSIKRFSWSKRLLQKVGSWVVRMASSSKVVDAPSGFRAFSREMAQRLVIFSSYTYTLETIIQAGQNNFTIISTAVRVTESFRPSRLVRSVPSYIIESIVTIVRIFAVYRPFRFFATVGLGFFSIGLLIGLRFVYFYLLGEGSGNIQSLLLASVLLLFGFQTILVAFLADLLSANRKLLEDVRFRIVQAQ